MPRYDLTKRQWVHLNFLYQRMRECTCTQSKRSGGYHVDMVKYLMSIGQNVRGMDNDEVVGLVSMLLSRGYEE